MTNFRRIRRRATVPFVVPLAVGVGIEESLVVVAGESVGPVVPLPVVVPVVSEPVSVVVVVGVPLVPLVPGVLVGPVVVPVVVEDDWGTSSTVAPGETTTGVNEEQPATTDSSRLIELRSEEHTS